MTKPKSTAKAATRSAHPNQRPKVMGSALQATEWQACQANARTARSIGQGGVCPTNHWSPTHAGFGPRARRRAC
jgi:hypothetical protein